MDSPSILQVVLLVLIYLLVYPSPVITKCYKLGNLEQQKFIFWQFWKLEHKNQGVGRVIAPLKALGKSPYLSLLSLWWHSAIILDVSWLVDASPIGPSPFSHSLLPHVSPTSLYSNLSFPFSYKDDSYWI